MKSTSRIERISIVVLTYNEAPNILRLLNSCRDFSEIILVDSYSNDDTITISEKFQNVCIYYRKFDDHSSQWNYAISLAKNDYVLCCDADYQLSARLIKHLSTLSLKYPAYFCRFDYLIFGKKIIGNTYPAKVVLFNKSVLKFYQDGHTQAIEYSGSRIYLKGTIRHDDRKSVNRWLSSQIKYADLESKKLKNQGINNLIDVIRKRTMLAPFLIFFHVMIFKGNILNGKRGLYYALQRVLAEIILTLKIYEEK